MTWIDGEDPKVCFGDLVVANDAKLASFTNSLNIQLDERDSHVSILNKVFRQLGVSCTDFTLLPQLIHRVTPCTLTDPVSRHPFEDRDPTTPQRDKPWMTPTEAPLYIFLAYLTMFVYSSVVL